MKKIKLKYNSVVKYFNSLINKIFLKEQSIVQKKFFFINKLKYYSVVKYFDSLINKILLKQQTNVKNKFFIKNKQNYDSVVKYFNSLINKILFKQQTKQEKKFFHKNKSKISIFNKLLIVLISLLFFWLFYLLIPILYDKNWVQNTLEKKIINKLKTNVSLSSDITYEILPSPHFSIKNAKIINQDALEYNEIAEIKELKVFISKRNFFNKKKLKIESISIINADFYLKDKDSDLFKKIIFNKSLIKKINIKKSNIFIRNEKNEIISIIKIPAGFISYDELNLVNTLNIKGEIFNVPFVFELINDLSSSNFDEINIRSKKINLVFSNRFTEKNKNTINGLNILKFFNLKLVTDYQYEKNSIKFNSIKSQTKKTGINYTGEVSLNPFNFLIDLDLQRVNFFKFINPNSIFLEFIKNNILFNKNLSAKINVKSKDIKSNKFFDTMKIIFNIKNGKIDLNQTFLTNHDIGSLKVKNSDFYFLDNKLIFSSDVNIDLKNLDNFYSLLQTPKKIRKKINNISINFSHDFLENHTIINSFTINNLETNDNVAEILQDFNNQESKNFIKSRGFVNKLLRAYSG